MSMIAAALKHMLAAGMDHDAIVAAVEEMESAATPTITKRQARNKRYYDSKKASENRLTKTHQDVSDAPDDLSPEGSSPTPPSPNPQSDIPPSPPKGGSSPVDLAISVFAENAERAGLPVPRKVTVDRRRKIEARLREHGSEVWAEACRKMAHSSFCRGSNNRGWRADLDFICQPKSFNGLIEGKYDDRKPNSAPAPVGPDGRQQIRLSMDTPDADRARYFIATGNWSKWWGYPPGDEDCSLPKALIRQCLEARRIAA